MIRRGSRRWRETSFAILDFETTGLDLERDHVLSYGLVPVEDGRVRMGGALYRVVRPPIPIPPESIRVHGVRPVELEEAPELGDVVGELERALESRELVAHAAGIELAFLSRMSLGRGRLRSRRALDVIDLAREVTRSEGGGPLESQRLSDLAGRFRVPTGRTHHALGDALITAQLFLVLATKLERLGADRVRDLRRAGSIQFARSFVAEGS